jgi:MerR family transcriptional regulator, light-induced transcriptional regulator
VRQKIAEAPQSVRCEDWTPPNNIEAYGRLVRSARDASADRLTILDKIVANKVIPRLLLANALPQDAAVSSNGVLEPKHAYNVGEFAEIVINRDVSASIAYFDTLRTNGASIESLFQDLLAPAARRLGELWDEDINDFIDVTRGFTHLHQIVNAYSDDFKLEGRRPASHRRALLVPLPGEQHTFGVALIGEQFRREGWRVWGGPPRSIDEIIELVDGQWFDVVGLSLNILSDSSRIERDIRAIRKASHNTSVKVLIGGGVFAQTPKLAAAVGADATAIDGRQAVSKVTKLIGTERRVT